ncbi:esterase [Mycobacterium deserti]|uniref:RsiV family protein n=1 Tax=Mycobacterium deserti TaxID=2978347 RepID=A0ABT2MA78_9MYCO|nr:esterase [Mycobacterium deserti]MCT7659159.1 RsiV family protein [Mycobacterium deserti]
MHSVRWAGLLAAAVIACATGTGTAAAHTGCVDLQGAVGPDGMCRVHVQKPSYTLDLSFPNDYPDQQPLVAYLTQARDGFVNVSEDPDAYNLPYELDAEGAGYRSGPPIGGTRSVVFTVWQNVGGAHPQTYYQAFNWDVAKNAPITFNTLFKPGSRPLDVIYPEVNRYLERQQGLTDPVAPGEGRDPTNYQNFALTDDSLIFFFSQGEMFPESAGPVQATVPRAAVAPMLAL